MKKRILILIPLVLAITMTIMMISQAKAENKSGSVTLYPTDDASIWMEYPDNNYGSSDHMGVRNRYGHPTHPDHWEVNALIKFDLSSISPGAIIISATLYLYYYDCVFNNCQDRDLTCCRITSGWDEGTVTWNTRPSYTSEVTSYSIVPSTWDWMDWNVTSDVQDFVDGQETNCGWEIMDTTTWRKFNVPDSRFCTKEHSDHIPYLEISFSYSCLVSPTSLDFDTVIVGDYLDTTFTITNIGEGTLSGSVGESCDHYSIVSGGGAYSLETGDSVVVTVRFEPASLGQHSCIIETGSDSCSNVSCNGVGQSPCQVSPTSLNFGTVTVGSYLDKSFTITNIGGETLTGTVSESCDHYSIVSGGGVYSLGADDSVVVTVRFEPAALGQHNCTIETGNTLCSDVYCTGVGRGDWYWKSSYEDYAPSGMPDIDQKQDNWKKEDTDQWTFCGPCAVANCFKWFDSKYNEGLGGWPGDGMDAFPLVRNYMDDLLPFYDWDDHDPWNVDHVETQWNPGVGWPPETDQPFLPGPQPQPSPMPPWGELVERLAWYFDTDGIQTGYCSHAGTNILQMQQGIQDWLESEMFEDGNTLADTLCAVITARPTFAYVESLVEKSENVILLLGFWYPGEAPIQQQFQQFIRGDINENGMVDLGDLLLCTAGGPFSCDDAADANDDGVLSMADCIYLSNYFYHGGPPPPPPFPDCGTDPTPDELDCGSFALCGSWWRVGGHYVTMAGVNSIEQKIAMSDPFIDAAELGLAEGIVGDGWLIEHPWGSHDPTVHNDAGNVSHDIYVVEESHDPCGLWRLVDYPVSSDPYYWTENFFAQNVPEEFLAVTQQWDGVSPIFTEVEYCLHISPWDYRGDVQPIGGDGVVDLGDLLFLINYLYKGGPAPVPLSEGDVNCDGIIDLGDVLFLISYLYKGGPVPRCCDP